MDESAKGRSEAVGEKQSKGVLAWGRRQGFGKGCVDDGGQGRGGSSE